MNEKSYTELMKMGAMRSRHLKETFVLDLYIDMVISEIQLNIEKAQLTVLIDKAIDEQNKDKFMELSNQFSNLTKRYGT